MFLQGAQVSWARFFFLHSIAYTSINKKVTARGVPPTPPPPDSPLGLPLGSPPGSKKKNSKKKFRKISEFFFFTLICNNWLRKGKFHKLKEKKEITGQHSWNNSVHGWHCPSRIPHQENVYVVAWYYFVHIMQKPFKSIRHIFQKYLFVTWNAMLS